MSSASGGATVIVDKDGGDAVTVTDSRLDVNAAITIASDDIEIGNVDIQLDGTAVTGNTGNYDAGTLRVTLAANDPLTTLMVADLDTIAGDTTEIAANFMQSGVGYNQTKGIISTVVRNDELTNLHAGVIDGDYTELQVDSVGGLYVTGSEIENAEVQSEPLLIGGRYDLSARTLGDGDAGAVALNDSGHMIVDGNVGHNITGMVQSIHTCGTDANQISGDTACKRVDLMGNPANAGDIYVGSADNISGTGSVGGIRIQAGDFYSIDIDNLGEMWFEASEASQILNCIYYT
jgi:hypothetical protein|tara:strand:- start:32 stop:904 length:873 start_codon:yes stop_codon:yes gene_type:complete